MPTGLLKRFRLAGQRRGLLRSLALVLSTAISIGITCEPAWAGFADAKTKIASGALRGTTNSKGVSAYLGIPFAKAPVGSLRWQPPQAPSPWPGVRNATNFGANCIQEHVPFGPWTQEFIAQGQISEDCLFLNVWTDTAAKDKKQPVMVFIHGGAFTGGSGSVDVYNGAELAKKGVVVVTLNYRLGPLGFLVHPELTKESPQHASGNYGLLDQIAALKWVKKNISAFGGDPASVTIFGQSAGAISVEELMQSPLAQGLFIRAIAESGPGLLPKDVLGDSSLQVREQQGLKYATALGARSLAELRALPPERFLSGAAGDVRLASGPVTDGWVLTEEPPAHQVPLLLGVVAGDPALLEMLHPQSPRTVDGYEASARAEFGPAAPEFLGLYPVTQSGEVVAERNFIAADRTRVAVDLWSAKQLPRSQTMYTYYFDRPIPWPEHPEFGAFHTAEVPYVFNKLDALDRPWTNVDFTLADTMSSYWSNFAKTGNPNGSALPDWPAYNPVAHTTMELGEHIGPMPDASPEKAKFLLEHLKSAD